MYYLNDDDDSDDDDAFWKMRVSPKMIEKIYFIKL